MTFSRDWSSDVCSSDLHDGEPVYPPTALMQMPGGNLAFGENHLAVATAEHLHVLRFDPGLEPPRRPPKPPRGPVVIRTAAGARHPPVVVPPGVQLNPAFRINVPADERPL